MENLIHFLQYDYAYDNDTKKHAISVLYEREYNIHYTRMRVAHPIIHSQVKNRSHFTVLCRQSETAI